MNRKFDEEGRVVNPPYPEYPYSPPVRGLFHEQVPTDKLIPGQYTVYIPDTYEPCSPAILLLPPNNTSARDFFEGTTGQGWRNVSDVYGITLIIAEPYNAGAWNLSNSVTMRIDEQYLYEIYNTINKKFSTIPAAFDLDERSLYIVGYEQGGNAAHKMAMMWPQLFGGLVSIDGGTVPETVMSVFGSELSFPFAQSQNSDGRETIGLINSSIPVPVWMIATSDSDLNSEAVKQHWITASNATPDAPNDYAEETYANGAVRVWLSNRNEISQETIYSQFLMPVLRFDHNPGGVLEWRVNTVNQNGRGFFFTETVVDGFLRRWITYVPYSYNESKAYPLIIGMHGGSNDHKAFIGDSRWHMAAERYDLIVVFPMAFPCPLPIMDWIPTPIWNQYVVSPSNAPDDVAFIAAVIDRTKQNYNIDASRVYATGHSNGAGMTWRLGVDVPELFTAIAPAGYTMASFPVTTDFLNMPENERSESLISKAAALENPLPVWVFMGRYDAIQMDEFRLGNWNDLCLAYWGERNGFNPSLLTTEYDSTGRYFTRNWTNEVNDIPLFRYSSIAECPHIYQPYTCNLVWQEFFLRITMDTDGKRYYNGQLITRN